MTTVDLAHHLEGPEDAPVLVLLNSLGTTRAMWDGVAPMLRERFRLVRYDHRGHGASPVPDGPYAIADLGADLLALLDRLGVERAHLCGLSIGGMTAMWLAAHAPDRVRRLVLCCTSAHLPDEWDERAATVRAEGTKALEEATLERWVTPGLHHEHPDRVEALRAQLLATPAEGYAGCCEAIGAMDHRGDLPAIGAATLVLAGDEDPSTPPEHGLTIATGIPDARLAVVAPARHIAAVEQPEEFARLIAQHLAEGDDARRAAGEAVRREVLGDAHVDRSSAPGFAAPFTDLITRHAWGDVWSRPGLDRRTRSRLTLALLAALGHHEELALHVRGALRLGLPPEEIAEVLLHTAVYAGVPAANAAFRVAREAIDADSGDPP